ncbi:hypothetical protein [Desulfocastanea catecholica]
MLNYRKTLMTCFLIVALLVSPFSALAETGKPTPEQGKISPEAMSIDIIAARPLGLAATVLGTVVFVVSWPFSALGGNSEQAWDTLVVSPAQYTFQRPLGDFNQEN